MGADGSEEGADASERNPRERGRQARAHGRTLAPAGCPWAAPPPPRTRQTRRSRRSPRAQGTPPETSAALARAPRRPARAPTFQNKGTRAEFQKGQVALLKRGAPRVGASGGRRGVAVERDEAHGRDGDGGSVAASQSLAARCRSRVARHSAAQGVAWLAVRRALRGSARARERASARRPGPSLAGPGGAASSSSAPVGSCSRRASWPGWRARWRSAC
jgi:hypothetical protein